METIPMPKAMAFVILDDDRAEVGDPGEQLSKAGPRLYRIGTAHRGGVEPVDVRGNKCIRRSARARKESQRPLDAVKLRRPGAAAAARRGRYWMARGLVMDMPAASVDVDEVLKAGRSVAQLQIAAGDICRRWTGWRSSAWPATPKMKNWRSRGAIWFAGSFMPMALQRNRPRSDPEALRLLTKGYIRINME
jgi:hypothetical protein